MAVETRRPTFYKISANKEFTDRDEPRKAFWQRYAKMCIEGSTIISFYGAGGVGKSALLEKIEDDIKHNDEFKHDKFKYVKYDFSIGTDPREVLKNFKTQLAVYGCTFPLFDVGDYYYSLKTGQDAKAPHTPSTLLQIPWMKKLSKSLSKVTSVSGSAMSVFSATKIVFKATTEVKGEHWLDVFLKLTLSSLGNAMPIMRTITTLMSVADMFLEDYLQRKGILDEYHKSIRNELNALRQEKNPMMLYKYLPILFAVDVGDWMEQTGNKLIIFLDNYESLISVTSFMTSEQLKRDLWLRGYDGLIHTIPNTLWTIAGRSELHWDGDLAGELEQHEINALSPDDSSKFLQRAGIADKILRDELIELTKGYPIFLDLCVNVYVEHKRQHNNEEPTIEAFGKTREEVVGRILRYINAAGAAVVKDILEFLCVLNVWIDELAYKIGKKALNNFSPNTYKLVKNFSFIHAETVKNDDISLTIYRFDKTIQSLLISDCDKFLVEEVRDVADEYFGQMFADKKSLDTGEIFCLKLWADIIVRFVDDVAELTKRYRNFLSDKVLILFNATRFDAAGEILRLFMSKLESLKATDTIDYTNFEIELGRLRHKQGKYADSYAIIKSACEKRVRLCGENDIATVDVMHKLAISLSDLARHEEALALREKVLTLRRRLCGDEHIDTLKAMNNLAVSLSALNRHAEAVKLLEKLLESERRILGEKHPDTIGAMNNLANSLRAVERSAEAVNLHEEAVTLNRKILGKKHPETIAAMNNLAISLQACGRREEAAILQKKVFSLSREILGKEHPNTLAAMNNLGISLNELGQSKKAVSLQKKVLSLSEKILGEKHPDTIGAMNNLAISLRSVGCCAEAVELHEKVLELRRQRHGNENSETLDAMNNLAISLQACERHAEAVSLLEELLILRRRIYGEKNIEDLHIINSLACSLRSINEHEKAIELQRKSFALSRELLGAEAPDTLKSANNLAWTLTMRGHYGEAVELMEVILPLCRRILGEGNIDTLGAADTLIHALDGLGRHAEALELLRESLNQCRETFGENHPLTVAFARSLADG